MTLFAFIATWWAGLGLVVGFHRARTTDGPAESLSGAAQWAVAWPVLWIIEAPWQ